MWYNPPPFEQKYERNTPRQFSEKFKHTPEQIQLLNAAMFVKLGKMLKVAF